MSDIKGPFSTLTMGRIVHVAIRLPGHDAITIRPAIVTRVIRQDQGLISAHVFKDPEDPPGEVISSDPGRMARCMGAELRYSTKVPPVPWTWQWPPRVGE